MANKTFFNLVLIILISSNAFSYDQTTHRYLVREAFSLLTHFYPHISNSELGLCIGNEFEFGDHRWEKGTVIAGAHQEDQEDVVYGYGPPSGWYSFLYAFLAPTYTLDPTVTHFWLADNGDNYKTWLPSGWGISQPYENAYMKLRKYIDGGWKLWYRPPSGAYIREYEYSSLVSLAKTGQIIQTGYFDITTKYHSISPIVVNLSNYTRKVLVYEILGRICHLLQDMTVPAHVHGDVHIPIIDEDFYESYIAQHRHICTWVDAQAQGGIIIPPSEDDPLRYFAYSANQIADIFGSKDIPGNTNLFNGTYPIITEYYNQLGNQPIPYSHIGLTVNTCYVYAIRVTASFLYWFCEQMDFVKSITVLSNQPETPFFQMKNYNDPNPQWSGWLETPYNFPFENSITVDLLADEYHPNYPFFMWEKRNKNNAPIGINVDPLWYHAITDETSFFLAKYHYYVNLSLNNILLDCNTTGGYYKNLHSNEINNDFQLFGETHTKIEAFAPQGYKFVEWSDHRIENPRTFFLSSNNAGLYAIFKRSLNSCNLNTFYNNNQRKAIKTSDGRLHLVYESMGKIWYETSVDNGLTWKTMNREQPISYLSNEARSPSICEVGNGRSVLIVYQEKSNQWDYITLKSYNYLGDMIVDSVNVFDFFTEIEYDPTPVIEYTIHQDIQKLMVVWKTEAFTGGIPQYPAGLYCRGGSLTGQWGDIITLDPEPLLIANTNENSLYPAIGCLFGQTSNPIKFHLVWQENGSSASNIKYREISYNGQQLTFGTTQTLSSGSGYTYNRYPSTVVMNDNIPRVTWQGERTVIGEEERGEMRKIQNTTTEKRVLFTASDASHFWGFGTNVGKPNINRSHSAYVMAWGEDEGIRIKRVNNTLNKDNVDQIQGIYGTEVQVIQTFSNSSNQLDEIKAMTLNNKVPLPYYFQIAGVNDNLVPKEKFILSGIGREGVVYKDTAQFYFLIGDINVNGSEIDFVEIPYGSILSNDSVLNTYMQTENFILNNTSEFLYSVQYGITDSMSAVAYLQNGNNITFAVELVDANTGALLGRFDEVTYNTQNIFQYDNLSYEVNTEGIGNREVYLRLVTSTNGEASYSLTNKFADESLIAKRHTKKINYTGVSPVKEYALSQNYPNPFNPVTTINYQIPKDGFVSLKVYDILGKEIATLVNSDKAQGRYTVEFDGSRFASGMYIYRLQSGDFVETRKMMLLK